MKNLIVAISLLTLAACGSQDQATVSPFTPIQDDQPAPLPVTPEPVSEPVAVPVVAAPEPAPQPVPAIEPAPVVSESTVQVIAVAEPMEGKWQCTAYIPNGYNYDLNIDSDGFDDGWFISEDGRIATTDQSNPQAGYHQCIFVGDDVEPELTEISTSVAAVVAQPDWTQFECSLDGTIYLADSNDIYNASGVKVGMWSSTPDSLDMNINNAPRSYNYRDSDLWSVDQLCVYVTGPSRNW